MVEIESSFEEFNEYNLAKEGSFVDILNHCFNSQPHAELNDSLENIHQSNLIQSVNPIYKPEDGLPLLREVKQVEDTLIFQEPPTQKCSESSVVCLPPSTPIYNYICEVIENGFVAKECQAGRPKQKFNTSREVMEGFLRDYTEALQSLIERNYSSKRSDTFRNTIFSYLKKLPIKLREKSCSVSEPKSKKLDVFLDAFLTPFVTCFLPNFECDGCGVPKIELFLYFITISYPEEKCSEILTALRDEGSVPESTLEKIVASLKSRKGKSKRDISNYIKHNPCFAVYCHSILNKVERSAIDEQARVMVQDFLDVHPEKSAIII